MNSLLITDLHLTANPRDEYRWALFDWLLPALVKNNVKTLFILGDLTEAKDNHNAKLVNRIVNQLLRLYRQGGLFKIYILRGNHDGIDPDCPYFAFLGHYPWLEYISTPYMFTHNGQEVLMLPHTNDPAMKWKDCDLHQADMILMHVTVNGSIGENGTALSGINPDFFKLARKAKIYSGDIHVPQTIGRVEYVGAPYPIRFGDQFQGRAVLLGGKEPKDLWVPSIQRVMVDIDAEYNMTLKPPKGLREGDQAHVRIHLHPHEFGQWETIKKDIQEISSAARTQLCGVELVSIKPTTKMLTNAALSRPAIAVTRDPYTALRAYIKAHKVGNEIAASGEMLLKDTLSVR